MLKKHSFYQSDTNPSFYCSLSIIRLSFLLIVLLPFAAMSQLRDIDQLYKNRKVQPSFYVGPETDASKVKTYKTSYFDEHSTRSAVYPSIIYPRFFKHKSISGHKQWNFDVSYFIINNGDAKWSLSDFKTIISFSDYAGDSVVQSINYTGIQDSNPSGIVGNSKDQSTLSTWSPAYPQLYFMSIKYNVNNGFNYEGIYNRIVGAREVVKDNSGALILNTKKINLFTAQLELDQLDSIQIGEQLKAIKRNNLNSVLIKGCIPHQAISICNQIGLLVINDISNNDFTDFESFHNYFWNIHAAPALIAWRVDKSFEFHSDLMTLESLRPIESKFDIIFDVGSWLSISNNRKREINKLLNPFEIFYRPKSNWIGIKQNHPFFLNTPMVLSLKIKSYRKTYYENSFEIDSEIITDGFNIPMKTISLNFKNRLECEIIITANENNALFQPGDVITTQTFDLITGQIIGVKN